MTEHILNFAVGIDDDAIINNVMTTAEKKICKNIEIEVMKRIFVSKFCARSAVRNDGDEIVVDRDAVFSNMAKEVVCNSIADMKEEIVTKAAEMLAESFKRTKAWKQATENVLNEVE